MDWGRNVIRIGTEDLTGQRGNSMSLKTLRVEEESKDLATSQDLRAVWESKLSELKRDKPDLWKELSSAEPLSEEEETRIDKLISEMDADIDRELIKTIIETFRRNFRNIDEPMKVEPVRLHLKDSATPVMHPLKRLSPKEKHIMREWLEESLQLGLVEETKEAEWISRFVIKEEIKPDGSVKHRVCNDLRDLNEDSIVIRSPTPLIKDVVEEIQGCEYITVMDAVKSFHQLTVDCRDRGQLGFYFEGKLYRRCRMPSGHVNSMPLFQRVRWQNLHGSR